MAEVPHDFVIDLVDLKDPEIPFTVRSDWFGGVYARDEPQAIDEMHGTSVGPRSVALVATKKYEPLIFASNTSIEFAILFRDA